MRDRVGGGEGDGDSRRRDERVRGFELVVVVEVEEVRGRFFSFVPEACRGSATAATAASSVVISCLTFAIVA